MKKKGSTMLTVLAIVTILMLLGGILLQAISMTMKSNTNQKEVEDVRYGADSGLEVARSYFDEYLMQDKNITEGRFADYEIIINERANLLEKGKIKEVDIRLEAIKSDSGLLKGIKIKSKATDEKEREENTSCIYSLVKNSNNNIYDYGVISGQDDLTIDVEGALGIKDVLASAGDKTLINGVEQTADNYKQNIFADFKFKKMKNTKKITVTKLDENLYPKEQYPNLYKNNMSLDTAGTLKFYDMDKLEQLEVTNVNVEVKNGEIINCIVKDKSGDSKKDKIFTENIKENIDKEEKESIVKISVKINTTGVTERHNTNIWIFNTGELDMDLKGQSLHVASSIILGSGKVNVTGTGTLTLDYATLYGNKLHIDKKTAVNISSPSGDDGHGIAPTSEDGMDVVINLFIDNWHKTDGMDTVNIKLNDKSFEK
ncbi:MAG: hypothetical protein ACRC30_03680 [Clostridium sp.]